MPRPQESTVELRKGASLRPGRLKLAMLLSAPVCWLFIWGLSFFPGFVERYYSEGIGRFVSRSLSRATGSLQFSVGEILVILAILALPFLIVRAAIQTARSRGRRIKSILGHILNLVACISLFGAGLMMLYTLNFYRLPFSRLAGLDVRPASVAELEKLCNSLASRATFLRSNVRETEDGIMILTKGREAVYADAHLGYERAAVDFPVLGGDYGRPKEVFFSETMARLGIAGIYNPLTGEANVNAVSPDALLAARTCHEMAHQRGFAREDEAEYLAYLACKYNPQVDFQYSGVLQALRQAGGALASADALKYDAWYRSLSPGIVRDLNADRQAFAKYLGRNGRDSIAVRVSTAINNTFLKSSGQRDGIRSYGRMVDLLIAEARKEGN